MSERLLCHTNALCCITQLLQWHFRGDEECFAMTFQFQLDDFDVVSDFNKKT